jgi:hypothetical protein
VEERHKGSLTKKTQAPLYLCKLLKPRALLNWPPFEIGGANRSIAPLSR